MEAAKSSLIDSSEDQREDATLNFNQNPENANQIPIKVFHLNTVSKSRKKRVESQTVKVKFSSSNLPIFYRFYTEL